MSDTAEMWGLSWRAFQRDLALTLGGDAIAYPALRANVVNVQSAGVDANSWLGRARLQVAALAEQVRQ
jgi:hypothetical protein